MKLIKIYLFSCLLVSSILSKIIGIIELVRHGARSTFSFPDKASKMLIDTQKGQLTLNGYRQHHILGKILRKNYIEKHRLISSEYDPKEIGVYSTPTQRTIFSATAQLSGLFPNNILKFNYSDAPEMKNDDLPPFSNEYNEDIMKKEVLINIISDKQDLLFRPLSCRMPNSTMSIKSLVQNKSLFNFTRKEKEFQINKIRNKVPELFKDKSDCNDKQSDNYLGEIIKFIIPVNYHYNNQRYLFDQDTEEFIRKIVLNKWYMRGFLGNNDDAMKLGVSGFYDEFLQFFSNIIMGDSKKVKLFFGHDSNIVNILSSLLKTEVLKEKISSAVNNITDFNFIVPQFASSLIFELHYNKEKDQHFVRILYNGKELKGNLLELDFDKDLEGIPFESFKTGLRTRIDMRYKDLLCAPLTIKKSVKELNQRLKGSNERKSEEDNDDFIEYQEIDRLKKRNMRKLIYTKLSP